MEEKVAAIITGLRGFGLIMVQGLGFRDEGLRMFYYVNGENHMEKNTETEQSWVHIGDWFTSLWSAARAGMADKIEAIILL